MNIQIQGYGLVNIDTGINLVVDNVKFGKY